MVYYNEFDPGKAAWLRELVAEGLIAKGDIDERSIRDVQPGDLTGYRQHHFFAGIGIWSYCLRLAGWSDDRPIWTASCPCQPFSVAGKRKGAADERHLWPVLAALARWLRPELLVGEQVAKAHGLRWFDDVCDDLEECGYTPGAIIAPACGAGAPHIRERLYWMAHASKDGAGSVVWPGEHQQGGATCGLVEPAGDGRKLGELHVRPGRQDEGDVDARRAGGSGGMVHAEGDGREQWRAESGGRGSTSGCGDGGLGDTTEPGPFSGPLAREDRGETGGWPRDGGPQRPGDARRVGDTESIGCGRRTDNGDGGRGECAPANSGAIGRMATGGCWAGADWVLTRPKRPGDSPLWRPVERRALEIFDWTAPGVVRMRHPSFPIAEGQEARTLRLKGYGDGIVTGHAVAFIHALMEELHGQRN